MCVCGSCFDQCSVIVVGAVFYDAKPSPPNVIGATLALTSITAYSLVRLPGSRRGIGKSVGGGAGAGGGGKGGEGKGSDTASEEDQEDKPLTAGAGHT